MNKISKTDAAYIAGFFDGEGCIRALHTKGCPTIGIFITQRYSRTRIGVLHWLTKVLGFGHLSFIERVESKSDGYYLWKTGYKIEVKHFIEIVLPYSIVKKRQLKIGLRLVKLIGKSSGGYSVSKGNLTKRLKLHKKLKELKYAHISNTP